MNKAGDNYDYTIDIPADSTSNIEYSCYFKDAEDNRVDTDSETIIVTDNDDPIIIDSEANPPSQTTPGRAASARKRCAQRQRRLRAAPDGEHCVLLPSVGCR